MERSSTYSVMRRSEKGYIVARSLRIIIPKAVRYWKRRKPGTSLRWHLGYDSVIMAVIQPKSHLAAGVAIVKGG